MQQWIGDFYVLHALALCTPALYVCVVYHFIAELVIECMNRAVSILLIRFAYKVSVQCYLPHCPDGNFNSWG